MTNKHQRTATLASSEPRRPAIELSCVRLFEQLPVPTLELIASRGWIESLRSGQFVFLEGTPANDVLFLLSGQVKIIRETEDGQEVILRLIQPGDIFGAAGGWGEHVYPASAVALDDSRVFRLPAREFSALIGLHTEFALAVIQELANRLREAESRIRELQAERVEQRIARTLLRLASKTGQKTTQGIQIDLPQSRQHLAELSGATLSTVSRVLSDWDRRGLILAGRERVTITKAHDLVMIAEDADLSDSD